MHEKYQIVTWLDRTGYVKASSSGRYLNSWPVQQIETPLSWALLNEDILILSVEIHMVWMDEGMPKRFAVYVGGRRKRIWQAREKHQGTFKGGSFVKDLLFSMYVLVCLCAKAALYVSS